ncbi:uncharacterized protein LOC129773361 [Toxorhynchites rutilus septentrionalis]|uniref:uncharacterized protein LOC129773361 n=1 Tax=Toxorhynchites rutilus septentrionalis TaxID=329112 RepID=UPI00247AC907|nr:uncharacterized protein LOC129773361 [Toxorhynchites rutilus septentrionalis]
MLPLCRLCLHVSTDAHELFEARIGERLLIELILTTFGIQLDECDSLPNNVCGHCLKSVEHLNSFHEAIINSQAQLNLWKESGTLDVILLGGHSMEASPDCSDYVLAQDMEITSECTARETERQQASSEFNDENEAAEHASVEKSAINEDTQSVGGMQDEGSDAKDNEHQSQSADQDRTNDTEVHEQKAKSYVSSSIPNKCYICNVVSESRSLFEVHLMSHIGMLPYQCSPCSTASHPIVLRTVKLLNRHIESHEFHIKCSHCPHRFRNKETYNYHMRYKHAKIKRGGKCKLCGKEFPDLRKYRYHMRAHRDLTAERFKCTKCQIAFPRLQNLQKHEMTHTQAAYVCPFCRQSFSSESSFDKHKMTHMRRLSNGEYAYYCSKCKIYFPKEEDLLKHGPHELDPKYVDKTNYLSKTLERSSIYPRSCEENECAFIADTINEMESHHKYQHSHRSNERKALRNCTICQATFVYTSELYAHIDQEHSTFKPPTIPDEDSITLAISGLSTDMSGLVSYGTSNESDEGQKAKPIRILKKFVLPKSLQNAKSYPLSCLEKDCNFVAKSYKRMIPHYQRHFKMHKCQQCEQRFPTASYLKLHIKLKHMDPGKNTCNTCGKNFPDKYSLKEHMPVHQIVRQRYKCEFCDKTFKSSPSRWWHTKTYHKREQNSKVEALSAVDSTMKNDVNSEIATEALDIEEGLLVEPSESAWKALHADEDGDKTAGAEEKMLASRDTPSYELDHLDQEKPESNASFDTIIDEKQANLRQPNDNPKSSEPQEKSNEESDSKANPSADSYEESGIVSFEAKNELDRLFEGKPVCVARNFMLPKTLKNKRSYPRSCLEPGCEYVAKTRRSMAGHYRRHYKPYKCQQCERRFPTATMLKTHIASGHMNSKKNICNICGKHFSEKSLLSQHMFTHQTVKLPRCQFCGKSFNYLSAWRRHINLFHNKRQQNMERSENDPKENNSCYEVTAESVTEKSLDSVDIKIETLDEELMTDEHPENTTEAALSDVRENNVDNHETSLSVADESVFSENTIENGEANLPVALNTSEPESAARGITVGSNEISVSAIHAIEALCIVLEYNFPAHLRESQTYPRPCEESDCDYVAKNAKLMRMHHQKHYKAFQCRKCDRLQSTIGSLRNHIERVHLKTRKFDHCQFCGQSFNSVSGWRQHVKKFHEQELENLKIAVLLEDTKEHLVHSGDDSVDTILEALDTQDTLDKIETMSVFLEYNFPMSLQQIETYPRSCEEPGCTHAAKNIRLMKIHYQYHYKPFQCRECSKRFSIKKLLRDHIEVHHLDTRIYDCAICHKIFKRKHNLQGHLFKHQDFETRKCVLCDASFSDAELLKSHIIEVHVGSTYDTPAVTATTTEKDTVKVEMNCKVIICDLLYHTNRIKMLPLCRLCLEVSSDDHGLFITRIGETLIIELILTTFGIQLDECDSLPNNVCDRCIKSLEHLNSFHEAIINSQTQLNLWKENGILDASSTDAPRNPSDYNLTQDEEVTNDCTAKDIEQPRGSSELNDENETADPALVEKSTINEDTQSVGGVQDSACDTNDNEQQSQSADQDRTIDIVIQEPCVFVIDSSDENCSRDETTKQKVNDTRREGKTDSYSSIPNKCYICNVVSESRSLFDVHIIRHEDLLPYQCLPCSTASHPIMLQTVKTLNKHIETHGFPNKCPHCPLRFRNKDSYDYHVKVMHVMMRRDKKCKLCGKEFSDTRKYRSHMRVHRDLIAERYKCTKCQTAFPTLQNMQKHEMTHTQPAYVCPFCRRSFSSESSFDKHKMTHMRRQNNGEYAYYCSKCKIHFPKEEDLLKHGPHEPDPKYINKTNYLPETLKFAITYPRGCEESGCTFVADTKTDMWYHYRYQHRDRRNKQRAALKCTACQATFAYSALLYEHMQQEHPTIPNADSTTAMTIPEISADMNGLVSYGTSNGTDEEQKIKPVSITKKYAFPKSLQDVDSYPRSCLETNCEFVAKTYKRMIAHYQRHFKMYKCHQCEQRFPSGTELRSHIRVKHKGTKKNTCSICGKFFLKKRSLKEHALVHTPAEQYKCRFCDKVCTSSSGRRWHIKHKHKLENLGNEALSAVDSNMIKNDANSENAAKPNTNNAEASNDISSEQILNDNASRHIQLEALGFEEVLLVEPSESAWDAPLQTDGVDKGVESIPEMLDARDTPNEIDWELVNKQLDQEHPSSNVTADTIIVERHASLVQPNEAFTYNPESSDPLEQVNEASDKNAGSDTKNASDKSSVDKNVEALDEKSMTAELPVIKTETLLSDVRENTVDHRETSLPAVDEADFSENAIGNDEANLPGVANTSNESSVHEKTDGSIEISILAIHAIEALCIVLKYDFPVHLRRRKTYPRPCEESGCVYIAKDVRLMRLHHKKHCKAFQCRECEIKVRTIGSLRDHIEKVHLKTRKFEHCQICDKSLNSVSGWRCHMKKIHKRELEDLKIDTLMKGTSLTHSANHEIDDITKEQIHSGDDSVNIKLEALDEELIGGELPANEMDPTQDTQEKIKTMLTSLYKHEFPKSSYPRACEELGCTYVGKNARLMRSHYQYHINPFQCLECNSEFPEESLLRDHMEVHHFSTRIYDCTICHKTYRRKHPFKVHLLNHQSTGTRKCVFCGGSFRSAKRMKTHIIEVHVNEESTSDTPTAKATIAAEENTPEIEMHD